MTDTPNEGLPPDADQQAIRQQLRIQAVDYAKALLDEEVPWGDATALNRVVEEYRRRLQACVYELIRVDE